MNLPWHLYLMAALYIAAGINHFRVPNLYLKIIPMALPARNTINKASGAAEIVLGLLLCVPCLTSYAAWGIAGLLIIIFPANIYMITNKRAGMRLPKWLLIARLPLQAALIGWALAYT